MQLHDIKQVSIVDYLAQTGFEAKLIKGVNYWYCSPLRSELTPSFKVNAERNQWYDFGTGDHGDIIDLVCALQHCSTAEAMRRLAALKGVRLAPSFSFGGTTPVRSQAPSMELISVQAVKHPKLLLYLIERGLQRSDASLFYLKSITGYLRSVSLLWDSKMTLEDGSYVIPTSRGVLHLRP